MMGFLIRRYKWILVTVVFLFAVIYTTVPYGRVLYRTSYIISHVVPAVPLWFEYGKYEVDLRAESLSGENLDIYLPQDEEDAPFIIFFPGFNPEGARDSRLVNLARAFAGAGIGVAVPDSQNIKENAFSRDDIELIKETFYFLKNQNYAKPDRIALSGFSIAGSYALIAASELGKEPLFVHSLGAYYNLGELAVNIISKKISYMGEERAWEPDSLSVALAESLREQEDYEARMLELSPSSALSDMKTTVFLMHDKNDNLIPVEESRRIRDALPKDVRLSYSEFSLLRHVTPQNLLSWDIVKLSTQTFRIMKLLLIQ